MNILTPMNQQDQIDALVDAGAREFYMGFADPDWNLQYGFFSDINRLTLFKEGANRYGIGDIADIAGRIHARGASLYITMNAPGYTARQKGDLEGYLDRLAKSGADGVIISEPDLISLVRAYGMKPVASTMCGIFNQDIAGFYRMQGIGRVILPRELTTDEIGRIMQAEPSLEYEVFLMRNGCRYSDANCLGLHAGERGAVCGSLRLGQVEAYSRTAGPQEASHPYMQQDPARTWGVSADEMIRTHHLFCHRYHEFTCGQCAIWRFLQMGVTALKIVGRMDDAKEIMRDVELTAENIRIAGACDTEEEYLASMRRPGEPISYCREGMSCYYPEVAWG